MGYILGDLVFANSVAIACPNYHLRNRASLSRAEKVANQEEVRF
jgi:hypothetical protein